MKSWEQRERALSVLSKEIGYIRKPHGDRLSYYCAELVLESCVAAGICDRETTRPSASFPHDLFYDQSYNRYIAKHLPLVHDWEPPARWSDCVK